MVFSSYVFLFYFLPIVLGTYYATPQRWRQLHLTLFSYVFYGWWNPWFILLMLFSTVVDFSCGRLIQGRWRVPWLRNGKAEVTTAERKAAVWISVVVNLSLLGFFKYFVFVQENLNWILSAFDQPMIDVYLITLPLGISFYTFQSMSYTIDLYRGHAQPAKNLLDFACYVSLFPQLVAGPIVRYSDIAHQLSRRSHTIDKFSRGGAFFIIGLAKKILLANPMGEVAEQAFSAGDLLWHDAWAGGFAFAFQVYFDFSGYSDMAIGLGLMLGFNFPKNFDSPYKAASITEFWTRWHITLSTWLRDYLYIPLGGNRKGPTRAYVNLFIVMFLGGLWHGAAWNYLIWGGIHGVLLALERRFGKNPIWHRIPRACRVAATFTIFVLALSIFRTGYLAADNSATVGLAVNYIGDMFGLGGDSAAAHMVSAELYDRYHALIFAACIVVIWGFRQSWDYVRDLTPSKVLLLAPLFLWSIGVMVTQSFNPFIYFTF